MGTYCNRLFLRVKVTFDSDTNYERAIADWLGSLK